MSTSIFEDALVRPELFHWFGIDPNSFKVWLSALPVRVHPGLVSLWDRTGGGDLFETETILGPLHPESSKNVLAVNNHHWRRGLPKHMVIFNIGTFTSASHVNYKKHQNLIVTLSNDSYEIDLRFETIADWYTKTLRTEFGDRYSLPDY